MQKHPNGCSHAADTIDSHNGEYRSCSKHRRIGIIVRTENGGWRKGDNEESEREKDQIKRRKEKQEGKNKEKDDPLLRLCSTQAHRLNPGNRKDEQEKKQKKEAEESLSSVPLRATISNGPLKGFSK